MFMQTDYTVPFQKTDNFLFTISEFGYNFIPDIKVGISISIGFISSFWLIFGLLVVLDNFID